jgi:hypothetical protein
MNGVLIIIFQEKGTQPDAKRQKTETNDSTSDSISPDRTARYLQSLFFHCTFILMFHVENSIYQKEKLQPQFPARDEPTEVSCCLHFVIVDAETLFCLFSCWMMENTIPRQYLLAIFLNLQASPRWVPCSPSLVR